MSSVTWGLSHVAQFPANGLSHSSVYEQSQWLMQISGHNNTDLKRIPGWCTFIHNTIYLNKVFEDIFALYQVEINHFLYIFKQEKLIGRFGQHWVMFSQCLHRLLSSWKMKNKYVCCTAPYTPVNKLSHATLHTERGQCTWYYNLLLCARWRCPFPLICIIHCDCR